MLLIDVEAQMLARYPSVPTQLHALDTLILVASETDVGVVDARMADRPLSVLRHLPSAPTLATLDAWGRVIVSVASSVRVFPVGVCGDWCWDTVPMRFASPSRAECVASQRGVIAIGCSTGAIQVVNTHG
jgi:hypothetical protein